jgi:UrcA family protein
MNIKRAIPCVIALAGTLSPGAFPGDRSVRISIADLDLSSPAGTELVYERIRRNATLLCRDNTSPWDARRNATLNRCVSAAIEGAIRRADVPQLTTLHVTLARTTLPGDTILQP